MDTMIRATIAAIAECSTTTKNELHGVIVVRHAVAFVMAEKMEDDRRGDDAMTIKIRSVL